MWANADTHLALHSRELFGNDVTTYRNVFTQKGEGMPQFGLVEQPEPGSSLMAHYHGSDQFQLFLDGSGSVGKHNVAPISVHYTNRYTAYGPIVAGAQGVNYYVFRPSFDKLNTGCYLHKPEFKEFAKSYTGKRRTLLANVAEIEVESLRDANTACITELFSVPTEEVDGGTLCQSFVLGPERSIVAASPSGGGGQLFFVLRGAIKCDGRILGARSGVWISPDESDGFRVESAREGAHVILMQFPKGRDDGV